MTILAFFIILIVLILAHELGHFVTAKMSGVKVEEFGIFLPPRIYGKKIGETIYSINAIPLGGFNRLSGEEDPKAERSLSGKSKPIRLLVLGAGSLMNLILPLLLLVIAFTLPHQVEVPNPDTDPGQVLVVSVSDGSPAKLAGIQPGDILLKINGVEISTASQCQQEINANLGKETTITIDRGNVPFEVNLIPRTQPVPGQGPIGVGLTVVKLESTPFWQAIPQGAARYWNILVLFVNGIRETVQGTVPFDVTGPVGIAQVVGEVAKTGMSNLLQLAAIISINLGIVNIFPIPGLDGGRVAFVLLEWVRRGKRVSPQTERLVHGIGFLLLMALIILVTYHDIMRIIHGQSPLG